MMQPLSFFKTGVVAAHASAGSHGPTFVCLDLNQCLSKALEPHQPRISTEAVVFRCDALPQVAGSKELYDELFASAINLLLQPGTEPLIYAYIKCEVSTSEIMDLMVPAEMRPVIISFLRSLPNKQGWLRQYKQETDQLAQLSKKLNIEFNTLPAQQEALFGLCLAGKI